MGNTACSAILIAKLRRYVGNEFCRGSSFFLVSRLHCEKFRKSLSLFFQIIIFVETKENTLKIIFASCWERDCHVI